eukprot:scaffold2583_cov140-Isochrysis_galbana.AAC.4
MTRFLQAWAPGNPSRNCRSPAKSVSRRSFGNSTYFKVPRGAGCMRTPQRLFRDDIATSRLHSSDTNEL